MTGSTFGGSVDVSAAALAFPETIYALVRIGTAQYGFWPSPDVYNLHLLQTGKDHDNPLKRVMSWTTNLMDLKDADTVASIAIVEQRRQPHARLDPAFQHRAFD